MTAAGSDAAVTGMSSGGAMGVDAGMTAAGSDAALGMSSGGTMSGTGGGAVGGGAGGAAGAPITASTPSVVNSAAPTTAGTLANAASLAKPLVGAAAALGASGVGSPQTPATPDYMALLDKQFQQQQALNAQTLQANRFNQVNPYGQSTWTTDANGNVTNTINLSPEQQALLSQNNQSALMSGGLAQNAMRNAGSLGQPIDTSGWFGMKGSIDGTGDAARQQTIASQYGAMTSRLDPQWTQRDAALKQQLANQGIAEGSEAYTNAMRDQSFARNDAYQQAMNSALQLGNQEQNTLFGQNAQNAAFGNQAQNQQYTQALGLQTQQLNAINALRNGSQVTTPQFQASGQAQQIQAPNYMSGAQAAYQGNLNASNAQNAYNNNMMSGLFGLGSAALQKWG